MVQESTDVTDGSRRKSGGAAMFEKMTRGATLEDLGFDAGNVANARSTQRVVEVYERRARGRSEQASEASAGAKRARVRRKCWGERIRARAQRKPPLTMPEAVEPNHRSNFSSVLASLACSRRSRARVARRRRYSDPKSRVLLPRDTGSWESFVALLVVLEVIYLPAQLSFELEMGTLLDTVTLVTDCVFVLDILCNFNLAYQVRSHFEDEEDTDDIHVTADEIVKLETRRNFIVMNYLKGWFVIDFLAILPLLLKAVLTDVGGLSLTKALRVPRLFRLLKVARIFRSLRSNNELRRFLLYSKYTSIFRLVGSILGICLMNHFIACAWWSAAHKSIEADKHVNDTSASYVDAFYQSVLLLNGEKLELQSSGEKM
jgi:hypothetical protein